MKVIVHAGLPKTGSTSIQASLFQNQDALRQNGIHVPILARNMPGHRKLSMFWDQHKKNRRRNYMNDADEVRAELSKTFRRAKEAGGSILLSTETLSDIAAEDGMPGLIDFLQQDGGEIQVIAYIRPPLELLPSSIQQELRAFKARDSKVIDRLLAHVMRAERLTRYFGEERTSYRIFDRRVLKGGDVIPDLTWWLGTLGVELPPLIVAKKTNSSISAPACAILSKARRHFRDQSSDDPEADFVEFRTLLLRFDAEQKDAAKLVVPQEWVAQLQALAAPQWNAFLPQTANTEEERALVRLPESVGDAPDGELDRSAWLMSFEDRGYERALLDYAGSSERSADERAAGATARALGLGG